MFKYISPYILDTENEIIGIYVHEKKLCYILDESDENRNLEYIDLETNQKYKEIIEESLNLRDKIQAKCAGQKVSDIKRYYDDNQLKEYLFEGYDGDINDFEIWIDEDAEQAMKVIFNSLENGIITGDSDGDGIYDTVVAGTGLKLLKT